MQFVSTINPPRHIKSAKITQAILVAKQWGNIVCCGGNMVMDSKLIWSSYKQKMKADFLEERMKTRERGSISTSTFHGIK